MNRRQIKQRLQFETRLKHGLFHLKLYLVFRDLSRCSIGTGFMVIQRRGLNSFNSASAGEIYTDEEGPKDEWKMGGD